MLKLVPSSRVHVSGRAEDEKTSSSHPATPLPKDWSMWSSDGRVMPPAGIYRITGIGANPAVRMKDGWNYPPNGSVVRVSAGDAIVSSNIKNYTLIIEQLVAETAPPPCGLGWFVTFLKRWRHGFKENSSGTGIRVGCGLVSEEARGRCVPPILGILRPLPATPSRVYPCGKSFPAVPVWGYRREGQRYCHNHYRRLPRLCVRHRQLPSRLTRVGGGR